MVVNEMEMTIPPAARAEWIEAMARAACDLEYFQRSKCTFPECDCQSVMGDYSHGALAEAALTAIVPLIAAEVERGRREEREACALVADDGLKANQELESVDQTKIGKASFMYRALEAEMIARMIRNRSTKP